MVTDFSPNIPPPISYLQDPMLQDHKVQIGLLRLDQLHPVISGNKWFKLKENLREAQLQGASGILTFGGAYSNHLIATAAAAKAMGLRSIGMVRGWHGQAKATSTLQSCREYGMTLHFLDREAYRLKALPENLEALKKSFPDTYILPEGGNNQAGISGAASIAQWIPEAATHVGVAVGTGTTLIGIGQALASDVKLLGFTAMKGGSYLEAYIASHLSATDWQLITDAHEGGFGKHSPELIAFMNGFYRSQGIPLDFVYTGKMMKRTFQLVTEGFFPEKSHLICLHTGGLQGNRSLAAHLAFPTE